MIRILHIARISVAGTERRVSLMASTRGFAFRLVRVSRPDITDELEAIRSRAPVEGILRVPMWNTGDPHRGLYRTLGFGIRLARPDIIHAEEEPDSLAALQVAAARRVFAPRARLVLFTWQNVNRPKRPTVRWVLQRTLSAADAVICGNRGAAAVLRASGFGRPTPIIPALALDPDTFRRHVVPDTGRPFTVGFVGRLVPEKGVDTLIAAVAAIGPPVRLALAGSGPARAALERLAHEAGLGDAVRFAGALEPDAVARFISATDVLVLPSRSTNVWQEQYGRVIVEAMGCEVPVIGSDSGAIPEVIADAGLIFPEGDAHGLATHLRALRESPDARAALGRRGHAHAMAGHTVSLRARQVVDFYRELLDDARSGAR